MLIESVTPANTGWVEATLDKDVLDRLKGYMLEATKDVRDKLAGNISREFEMPEGAKQYLWETCLSPMVHQHVESFGKTSNESSSYEKMELAMDSLWVNYQKQGEVNPLHRHSGVYSFAIWMNIPTDWREQHALPEVQSSAAPVASNFEFSYTTILGDITQFSYFLDRGMEGKVLLFPAKLSHQVYPFFNCKEERVSIAGNIALIKKVGLK